MMHHFALFSIFSGSIYLATLDDVINGFDLVALIVMVIATYIWVDMEARRHRARAKAARDAYNKRLYDEIVIGYEHKSD